MVPGPSSPLRLAAPYLAVLVFWCLFRNAWLAILAHHAQILWGWRGTRPRFVAPRLTPATFLILASWLWKRMVHASGSLWPAIASQGVADLGIVLAASHGFKG